MNYLVIDLEMCKVPRHYRSSKYKYSQEIIQAGAVLLDEEYEVIGKINQYVRPIYGVLDHFITNMTGIHGNQLRNAPELKEVLVHMLDWIGDRDYKVYAWSNSDHMQLQHEIISKEICDSRIDSFMEADRWVDYQDVFGKRFDFSRAISLEEALISCNIDVDGHLHNGLDDAMNTAAIIRKLELDREFELYAYNTDQEDQGETLHFCLGDLFSKLDLGCIA